MPDFVSLHAQESHASADSNKNIEYRCIDIQKRYVQIYLMPQKIPQTK